MVRQARTGVGEVTDNTVGISVVRIGCVRSCSSRHRAIMRNALRQDVRWNEKLDMDSPKKPA